MNDESDYKSESVNKVIEKLEKANKGINLTSSQFTVMANYNFKAKLLDFIPADLILILFVRNISNSTTIQHNSTISVGTSTITNTTQMENTTLTEVDTTDTTCSEVDDSTDTTTCSDDDDSTYTTTCVDETDASLESTNESSTEGDITGISFEPTSTFLLTQIMPEGSLNVLISNLK